MNMSYVSGRVAWLVDLFEDFLGSTLKGIISKDPRQWATYALA